MIHRDSTTGQKLDVAGLNEITVLIDRSETELTEVAMNAWTAGLDGPPHSHDRKEQNFLVTSGHGIVKIGSESFPAFPGSFFYVPAGVVHQTITNKSERLVYFLFNAFLDRDKEGHASFADHIDKVRETRRAQAATQRAAAVGSLDVAPSVRRGKCVDTTSLATASTFLNRAETERCEAVHHRLESGERIELTADGQKEQTFFVLSGEGSFGVGQHEVKIRSGQVVFVPRHAAGWIVAGSAGVQLISFGTVVER